MSAKYDLLANSNISDFDAVEVSGRKKSGCKLSKIVVILIVAVIITTILLTLFTVIVIEATKHRPNTSPPPATQCPSVPPQIMVPCSNTGHYNKDQCAAAGCCWYSTDQCVLSNYNTTCPTNSVELFTCLPENDDWNNSYAMAQCNKRGCCWNRSPDSIVQCYYPSEYGYVASTNIQDTSNGKQVTIERKSPQPSMYGNDIQQLTVQVTYETSNILRVKIFDNKVQRYEVPLELTSDFVHSTQKPDTTSYTIDIHSDNFGFEVKRTHPKPLTIFKTGPGFVYSDQFLQLSGLIPSHYIYGLGEHATPWKLDTNYTRLTMFARDVPPDPVNDINRNLYGVHPFYLCMEEDGSSHGVFLANSNAMEVELLPYPAISYRTIGGVIDLYYFMGPTPEAVISQYTQLIGRSYMPPYWSLGFHLCRWGYLTANRTMDIVLRMRDYEIPQDTQWNDIDYMNRYLDFSYNHTSFEQLPQLVENLHSNGQHYVVITDPGISAIQTKGSYPPFDDGVNDNIFILNSTGQPILGKVWPGITAYPDFTNPQSVQYWSNEIDKFHKNVKFDGLWIDMNEPSNFVPGSISVPSCPSSSLNTPPFLPTSIRQSWAAIKLTDKTLCMTAIQNYSLHYNVHSLYGHTEAIVTMTALEGLYKRRSLVISRSTFPGSGTHCGHWLGDNASQWPHIRQSIPGILNFALFGIPLVGADICGFFDNTTEQLCTRWQQLGAFYPFSRNHNTFDANPQDPTQFSEYSINSTRDVLLIRYKLLPFLYTLFYHANVNGTTVGRPLLSVFPSDKNTWTNGRQFMWGDSLLISPVIEENATSVVAYFPQSRWFDYRTGEELVSIGNVTLEAPLNYIPLHVKGGRIIPQQQPNTTTINSRKNSFSLLVALDNNDSSIGDMFLDDGEELHSIENGHYSLIEYEAIPGQLKSVIKYNGFIPDIFHIAVITVYGLIDSPQNITYNNEPHPLYNWTWTNYTNVLDIVVDILYNNIEFIIEWD